jgi:hypothetical protein
MVPETFILGFCAALIAVAALLLVSYIRSRRKTPKIKGYLDLMSDLSDEQRLKVQVIRQTFLPKVERIRQHLCELRLALAKALFSEPTDRAEAQSISQEILRCQSELEQEVIEHIIEEKELLSSKQQKRFFEIIVEQFSHGGLGVHDVRPRRKP